MGNDPPTTRPSPFENDQVRFGLLLAGVSAGLIAVLLARRIEALDIERPLRRIEQKVDERRRGRQAKTLRAACRRRDCACVRSAVQAGLDVDAGRDVLEILDAAKTCELPSLPGMRAEAKVRTGATAEGKMLAGQVLERNQRDTHARTALGLAAYQAGAWPVANDILGRAVEAGAGDGARMLAGLSRYHSNDLPGAREAFQAVLVSEPEDLDATYNLALVAQKQDRYGEARRLYLTVLRAKPDQRQARYNLAILAHSIGAEPEARHHQALLEKAAPGDPMLAALRAELATPSKRKGQVLTLGGTNPASSAR